MKFTQSTVLKENTFHTNKTLSALVNNKKNSLKSKSDSNSSEEPNIPVLGAPSELSGNDLVEVKALADTSLTALAAGDGPNYSLVKIHKATSQVVAGTLYKIEGEFSDGTTSTDCTMKIWSRPWIDNGNEVTVKCPGKPDAVVRHNLSVESPKRVLRQLGVPGGVNDVPESEYDQIRGIAQTSLTAIASGDRPTYSLVSIKKATKQVVSGMLYKIEGVFSDGTNNKDCRMEIWSQPWLDNGNEVTMNCDGQDEIKVRHSRSVESPRRLARQVGVPGGVSEVPESEYDQIRGIAQTSLTAIASGDRPTYSLVSIKKATRQTVSGTLYKIEGVFSDGTNNKDCRMEIWSQPWLDNGNEVTMNCDGQDEIKVRHSRSVESPRRLARQVGVPGGVSEVPESEYDQIRGIAQTSLTAIASGDRPTYSLVSIKKATRQTVSGTLYKIEGVFSDGTNNKDCRMEIWSQPWLDNGNEVTMNCDGQDEIKVRHSRSVESPRRLARQVGVPGGVSEVPESEYDQIRGIAQTSLTAIASGDRPTYSLVSIKKATRQTVSGTLYKIEGVFSDGTNNKDCRMEIWSQPWLDNGNEVTMNCDGQDEIKVRHSRSVESPRRLARQVPVLGGVSEVPESEYDQIRGIAQTSLTAIASGDGPTYSLVSIKKATKQVVSGMRYKIEGVFSDGTNNKDCRMEIWSQPWLDNGNEVTMNCDGQDEIKVRHSRSVESQNRMKRQGGSKGAPRDIPESEYEELRSTIQKSLTAVATGDGPSYSLVSIKKATKQVVSGSLYKIEGVFSDGTNNKDCRMEIWSQPWLDNGNEVTMNCDGQDEIKVRHSRSVESHKRVVRQFGAPSDIPESQYDEIRGIAQTSLSAIAAGDGPTYSLVSIKKASRQTVSGTLYKIEGVFSDGTNNKDCRMQIWSQPWLDNGNEVTINCDGQDEIKVRHSRSVESPRRFARQVGVPGGVSEVPESEYDQIRGIAQTSLTAIASGDRPTYSLVSIKKATRQTVSGTLYKIEGVFSDGTNNKDCRMEIWSQPWLDNGNEVTMNCDGQDEIKVRHSRSVESPRRLARQVPVLGGVSEVPESEYDQIRGIAQTSLTAIASGDGPTYSLVSIKKATKQVVSGMLYKIEGVFSDGTNNKDCRMEIWSQPWLDNGNEVTMNCDGQDEIKVRHSRSVESQNRMKRQGGVRGAPSDIPESEYDELRSTVQKSLTAVATGDGPSYSLVSIKKATRQVVSGTLYKIEGVFSDGTNNKDCRMQIWSQPWLDNGNEVTINCDGQDEIKVRHSRSLDNNEPIVGAPAEVKDDEYDEIKQVVQRSLVALAGGDGPTYTLEKIYRATRQIVSGTFYKVNGEFSDGKTSTNCSMTIWSQPWLDNGNEVTINCDGKDETKFRHRRSLINDDTDVNVLFEKFKLKYKRAYDSRLEHRARFEVFKQNVQKIRELNEKEQGTAIYGITEFTDLTEDEFKQHTGLLPDMRQENAIGNADAEIPNIKVPRQFDWRNKGVVSEVKNQGNCGSCWAFSVTGNIEGLQAIKSGQLEEYSEQELLDCDSIDNACGGGLPDNAYKAIEEIGGLELESEYPYRARKDKCSFNKTLAHVQIRGAVDLPKNETAMVQWLVANGPISIGINANAMMFYRGGISHPWRLLCRPGGIDHGVLIVGYGVVEYPVFNKTLPYWIVKNSWGPSWGEQGYYRVFRGDNTCGIHDMASSALL